MAKAREGILIITDITGYAAFLGGTELGHAEDSLRSLLTVLVEHTRPPQAISHLEGNAVFSYAPAGSFYQGQTLVEMIENSYIAFRQAREQMVLNTTCDCVACHNIPSLDLNFFVHYGTYSIRQQAGETELAGSDVNLVRLLVKNTIGEKPGIKAYAAYTQAVIEALELEELAGQMSPHEESYEHLGRVLLRVQDLNPVWARERDQHPLEVNEEEALGIESLDYPLPPEQMWDYLTKAEYRSIFVGVKGQYVTEKRDGRTGPGTIYHGARGRATSTHTLVDWRPFETYGWITPTPIPTTSNLYTVRLEPSPTGTRITYLWGHTEGRIALRQAGELVVRYYGRGVKRNMVALKKQILRDITDGRIHRPVSGEVSAEEVEATVAERLRGDR